MRRSFTWSLRKRLRAFSTSGRNLATTCWRNAPSYTLEARSFTKSSDGSLNCSAMTLLREPTYLSSSALDAMESMSNDGLVSFWISGSICLSMSRRSSTRKGLESILFGSSRSM